MKVGGALAVACPHCKVPPGVPCRRVERPHPKRVAASYPESDVGAGDLVIVSTGRAESVAQVLEVRSGVVLARRWLHASARWSRAREVPAVDVRGPAPDDDERVRAARGPHVFSSHERRV